LHAPQPLEQCLADIGFAIGDPSSAALDIDAGFPDGAAFTAHRYARAVTERAVTVPGPWV
jgi:hypothetical protein